MRKLTEVPLHKTLAEVGLDQFGQAPLAFRGPEINKRAHPLYEVSVIPNFIQSGDFIANFNMADGYIKSNDYEVGVSGWILRADGTYEFN